MSDYAVPIVMRNEAVRMIRESNVDTGKVETKCPRCSDSEFNVQKVLAKNDLLNEEVNGLKIHLQNTSVKLKELQQRSNSLTEIMSEVMENKSDLENVNDEFCNIQLGKRFEKLYSNEWTNLSDWFEENVENVTEQHRMRILSKLLKKSYAECVKLAEDQIRTFLFLNDTDKIPDDKEKPTLYKERRKLGQDEYFRDQIQKRVIESITCIMEESVNDFCEKHEKNIRSNIQEKIERFLRAYIDLCWLFTISHPCLCLEFDVEDKPYCEIRERFCKYASQDLVRDEAKVKDSVDCLVWPCLILEDASGIIVKGSVVTVDIGKEE